jgi:diguanylate cyclase (GGDEF)-like protein
MSEQPQKTMAVPRQDRPAALNALPCLQILTGAAAGRLFILTDSLAVGRDPGAAIHFDDPGVSWQHAQLLAEAGAVSLQDLGSTNGTFIGPDTVERRRLTGGEVIQFGPTSMAKFGYLPQAEIDLAIRLFENATRDHLTGVLNRGSFLERLEQEISLGLRQSLCFALVMLDVDHFKRINDTYGHPAGDAVLRHLASLLRSFSRFEDIVGRFGGEEFTVLLRNSGAEEALSMAERIRQAVEDEPFWVPRGDQECELRVTVSLGLACWNPELSQERLLAVADEALYQAKEGGRNRVVQSPGPAAAS